MLKFELLIMQKHENVSGYFLQTSTKHKNYLLYFNVYFAIIFLRIKKIKIPLRFVCCCIMHTSTFF